MKFVSEQVHQDAVNKAYQFLKNEIDLHFRNGGSYREWEFEYGSETGKGFTNTGTRSNPVILEVSSTKVKIAFKPDPTNPRGYILDSAYPSYP